MLLRFLFLILISSCSYDSDIDKTTFNSYKDKLRNIEARKNDGTTPVVMDVVDVVILPEDPSIIYDKYITISTSEEVPLIDMLLEISRISGIDMQIDPGVIGSMIISAKDKPLKEIFDRITEVNDVRYSEKNGVLFFEQDIPYVNTYSFDFLDMTRSSSSSLSLSASVVSAKGGSSSSSVSSSSNDEFWTSVDKNIKQIIESTETVYNYRNKLASSLKKKKDGDNDIADDDIKGGSMSLNKRAGLLNVTASDKAHKKIKIYLDELKRKVNAQVLIELKFVEVQLKDNFAYGIDWSLIHSTTNSAGNVQLFASGAQKAGGTGTVEKFFGVNGSSGDLSYVMNMLETFGTTRTLANPRINALNNQPALLTFADNQVYFKIDVDIVPQQITQGVTIPERKTFKSDTQTVPIGIIMSVLPSIDLTKNEILLSVRPSISVVTDTINDPTAAYLNNSNEVKDPAAANAVKNAIPITAIRELDSMLKMKSGDIMVIGGFTQRKTIINQKGLPFFSKIPLLKYLFSSYTKDSVMIEMVILIKATIVNDNNIDTLYNFEKDIYKEFSDDPRMGDNQS